MGKILCFIDCLGAGGAQRQFVGLVCMLKKCGYDLKVITYYDVPFYQYMLDDNNIDYECVKGCSNPLSRILNIHKAITNYNPSILISFLDTPCIISCIDKFLWNRKYKLLVSERNTTQKLSRREKIKFFLYKISDTIVPNAYAQGLFIDSHFPKLRSKVHVIHNFVDLEHFSCKKDFKRHKVPQIIIVASIWEQKNTLGFIEAARLLKEKGILCEFHWYGKTGKNLDYLSKCEDLIKKYNLSNYIFLHDKTKNIKEVYQNADYFCLPSFYEGTPNVICEAMACGLPVICSNVCDNARYVHENKNGFLFSPSSSKSIVLQIINALSISDDEYCKMSLMSRTIAEKELSKDEFIRKYINVINS